MTSPLNHQHAKLNSNHPHRRRPTVSWIRQNTFTSRSAARRRLITASILPGLLLALMLSVFGLTACSKTAATDLNKGGTYQTISADNAVKMMATVPNILLLDVRTAEERAAGYISGSQFLPYDEIKARAAELPQDKTTPIIVYCRSGRRSKIAAETLLPMGYTNVYDLGGINDWPGETVK